MYWVLFTGLVLIAGLTAISTLNFPGNYKMMVVLSGSMEPAIKTGSVVVVKPADSYQKGDIITFEDRETKTTSVTHRIVEVKEKDGNKFFVTKGDANDAPDSNEVSQDQIVGKTLFSIPYIGYPVNFTKTLEGLIVLVVIPATLIIYSEIINIKNEAVRLIVERKKRKLTALEKVQVAVGQEILEVENEIKEVGEEIEKAVKPVTKTKRKNAKKIA